MNLKELYEYIATKVPSARGIHLNVGDNEEFSVEAADEIAEVIAKLISSKPHN